MLLTLEVGECALRFSNTDDTRLQCNYAAAFLRELAALAGCELVRPLAESESGTRPSKTGPEGMVGRGTEMETMTAGQDPPSLPRLTWWQLVFIVGVPLFLLTSTCYRTPGARPVASGSPAVTLERARPEVVAGSFLQLLRMENLKLTYGYLSTQAKSKLSEGAFQKKLLDRLRNEDLQWELPYREIRPGPVEVKRASVEVVPPERGNRLIWQWELVKEASGWKIDRMRGGPVEL